MIFDSGFLRVYKIAGPAGSYFEGEMVESGRSMYLIGKGTIEIGLKDRVIGQWSAPYDCKLDNDTGYDTYDDMLKEHTHFNFTAVTDTVNYCICTNLKKNFHDIYGEVNKYSKGETVTFDTDYILIADGSVSVGNNKYNTDTVLSKPKTVTITQDCVIASFNVRKK